MLYKFFEPTQDVVKMVSHKDFIYVAYSTEIVVLSLKRLLQRKDIIKKKIPVRVVRTFDPLTSAFNDNKQMNFISLAIQDDKYPILHSSNLEKRIITLNSEQPQIKDFFVTSNNSLIVLCNNGALLKDDELLYEQVKSVCVNESQIAVYQNTNQLILNGIIIPLTHTYKDEVKYDHKRAVLYNSTNIFIVSENGEQKQINNKGALQVEIIDSDTLYVLKEDGIHSLKIESSSTQFKLQLDFLSKFYVIDKEGFLFKNGHTYIDNKWSTNNKVINVCASHNKVVHFVCLNETMGQSLNCLITEKKSLEILKMMVNPLIEREFTVPLYLSDFKIYFHYINDQINVLKIARSLFQKKRPIDSDFQNCKPESLNKAMGAAILNLLAEMNQMQLFKEFYLHRYVVFLESIKPTSDKIKYQLSMLDKSQKPPTNFQLSDTCPVCQDNLISWTACPKHRFMRCSTTLVPLYEQSIIVCRNCELQTIENLEVCPVCCCEMNQLL